MRKEYDFSNGVRGKAKDAAKKLRGKPNWFKVAAQINTIIMDVAKKSLNSNDADELMELLKKARQEALRLERQAHEHTG